MNEVSSKYRGSKKYFLVYCELITAARFRGTVTYQEIAVIMGLPLRGSHMGRETGHILGEISEDEHGQGRPMLSAIAVSAAGVPGPGFFGLAKQLGKLQDDSDEGHRQFWEAERAAIYSEWRKELKT